MTATAAAVSPKRTSGRSPWLATSNARRSSKLDRKTRPTNCSNIHRWYRSGWGRYTQSDPLTVNSMTLPPHELPFSDVIALRDVWLTRPSEQHSYGYSSGQPINRSDPTGVPPCVQRRQQRLSRYRTRVYQGSRGAPMAPRISIAIACGSA
jgi:hypothetical protein